MAKNKAKPTPIKMPPPVGAPPGKRGGPPCAPPTQMPKGR